jgi:hypothetical protein
MTNCDILVSTITKDNYIKCVHCLALMVNGRLRKGYNEPRDEETMEKNQQALALNIRMIPCLR